MDNESYDRKVLKELNTRKDELKHILQGVLPYTQVSIKKYHETYGLSVWDQHVKFIDRYSCSNLPFSFNKDTFTKPFEFLFSNKVVLSDDDFVKFQIQLVYTELQSLWVEFLRKYVTDYHGLQKEFLSTLTDILRAVQFNGSVIATALQKAIVHEQSNSLKKNRFMEDNILQVNVERLQSEARFIKKTNGMIVASVFALEETGLYRDYTYQFLAHLHISVNNNREIIRNILGISSDT